MLSNSHVKVNGWADVDGTLFVDPTSSFQYKRRNFLPDWTPVAFPSSGSFGVSLSKGKLLNSPALPTGSRNSLENQFINLYWDSNNGYFFAASPISGAILSSLGWWAGIDTFNSECDIPSPDVVLSTLARNQTSVSLEFKAPLALSPGQALILAHPQSATVLYVWMYQETRFLSQSRYHIAEPLVRFWTPATEAPFPCRK